MMSGREENAVRSRFCTAPAAEGGREEPRLMQAMSGYSLFFSNFKVEVKELRIFVLKSHSPQKQQPYKHLPTCSDNRCPAGYIIHDI